MSDPYQFNTTLTGFVNVYEDSGQYNNRGFGYTIPQDIIEKMEEEREGILDWCKTKAKGKVLVDFAPWERNEEGVVKYSYSDEGRSPEPVFVDSTGMPIDKAVLRDLRKGTEVNIIVSHKASMPPGKIGSKLVVHGIQIVKLATGNGASDSGNLTEEEVKLKFGVVKGYSQAEPSVRKEESSVGDGDSYDF